MSKHPQKCLIEFFRQIAMFRFHKVTKEFSREKLSNSKVEFFCQIAMFVLVSQNDLRFSREKLALEVFEQK